MMNLNDLLEKRTFDVLFSFANDKNCLFEVKYTDVPSDASPDKTYQWFLMSKEEDVVIPLSFQSMAENQREFSQGVLNFDDEKGSYQSADKELFLELIRVSPSRDFISCFLK